MRKSMLQLNARWTGSSGPNELPHMAQDWAKDRAAGQAATRANMNGVRFMSIINRGRREEIAPPTFRTRNTSRARTSPAPHAARRGRPGPGREPEHEVHADQPREEHRFAGDQDDHGEARVADRRSVRRGERDDVAAHGEESRLHA